MRPYGTGRRPWRSEPPTPETESAAGASRKLVYFGLVILVAFAILTAQLARLQLIRGDEFRQRAETNRLRQEQVRPSRGLIFDRNGLPLVENIPTFAAAVVAADIPVEREQEISTVLQELTGVPAGEITAEIEARRISNDPFSPAIIRDGLPAETAFALRERLALLPGVRVIVQPLRSYTQGDLFTHILGFVGPIDAEEYDRLSRSGYEFNDYLGKAGVELSYEAALRGLPGTREVEADASGREIRILKETPARPGQSIVLSIDVELQKQVADYLAAAMGSSKNAAAIVVEVETGEILSLVSLPTYDNNIFAGRVDDAALQYLLENPAKPLVNHAIAEMYPPGSTFKQVTGLAALQEGVASASTEITSHGSIQVPNQYNPDQVFTFRDWAVLGTLDFYRGIAMSSDVYFYYLAGGYTEDGRDLFQGLGASKLASWSRRFGLGEKTGIDLPGESPGLIPDPEWKEQSFGTPWVLGDTYNFGIGQGYVATTPLQMALVTTAIANGGNVLTPTVVKEVRDSAGRVLPLARQPVRRNLGIDRRNLNIMREGMRQAVDSGTARTAQSSYVTVAGKTGTAEFGERRPDGSHQEHGWFTGYAPFGNPEIAVAVFLEQGNGQLTAAPVAARIFDYYFGLRDVARGTEP